MLAEKRVVARMAEHGNKCEGFRGILDYNYQMLPSEHANNDGFSYRCSVATALESR